MSIRDSIRPLLQSLSLTIVNPESTITKIKVLCEEEIKMRVDGYGEFDSGVKYMARKILKVLEDQ